MLNRKQFLVGLLGSLLTLAAPGIRAGECKPNENVGWWAAGGALITAGVLCGAAAAVTLGAGSALCVPLAGAAGALGGAEVGKGDTSGCPKSGK